MVRVVLEHDQTIWKVSCFAADRGLVFYDKIAPGEGRPEEVIWASRDAATRLHRIDDPYSGLVYLQIEGDGAAGLAADAEEALNGLTAALLIAAMKGRSDEAISPPAVAALGVLAPAQADEDFLASFRWLLGHADPGVRMAAIAATAYAVWPELAEDVAALAASDPDEAVRAYAANAAAVLRERLADRSAS